MRLIRLFSLFLAMLIWVAIGWSGESLAADCGMRAGQVLQEGFCCGDDQSPVSFWLMDCIPGPSFQACVQTGQAIPSYCRGDFGHICSIWTLGVTTVTCDKYWELISVGDRFFFAASCREGAATAPRPS